MKHDYTQVEFWTTECDIQKVRFIVRIIDSQEGVEGLDIRKLDHLNNYRRLTIRNAEVMGEVLDTNNPVRHLMNMDNTSKILDYWTGIFDGFKPSPSTGQADAG